jgi:hypothetical protein
MPSKRVMTIMAPLPDGTFLIMGGAEAGVAGFGLANTPNLQAILYDPTKPRSQRFSILNTTIVARLYHSEATLLAVSQKTIKQFRTFLTTCHRMDA